MIDMFMPFAFNAALAKPVEGPFDMPATFENTVERGLCIRGSPDTVNRKLEALFKQLPVDYFWMFIYNHAPLKALMRSLQLLTEQVWPDHTDTIKAPNTQRVVSAA